MSSLPPVRQQQQPEAIQPMVKVGQVPVDKTPTAQYKAFFVFGGTTTYVMRNGTQVAFRMGAVPAIDKAGFVTNIAGYIAELEDAVAQGHPVIHIEPGYEVVTQDMLDPHDAIKKKAVLDYLKSEEFKKFQLQNTGVGTPKDSKTEQSAKLDGIASTADVGAAAAGSDSPGAGAPLTLGSITGTTTPAAGKK